MKDRDSCGVPREFASAARASHRLAWISCLSCAFDQLVHRRLPDPARPSHGEASRVMILLIEARAIVRVKGGHVPGRDSSDKPGLCGNIRTWMPARQA